MRLRQRILDLHSFGLFTACLWAALLTATVAHADVLLDQTNLVGATGVAAPVQYSFTESTAEALVLTLTDDQAPAAFSSLQVAVTLGDSLVGSGTVGATHTATVKIPAGAGTYTVHVIGTPNAAQGIGLFGVCVAAAATPTTCIANYSYSGNIFTPSPASSTPSSALDTNFTTSAAAGTYTVTITDAAFPAALQSISGGIAQGTTQVIALPAAGTYSVTLAAATSYTLIIGALANATAGAGLYTVNIADPTGAAVFARTLPVGALASARSVDNTASQGLNLTLTDEMYPATLSGLGVAITAGSTVLGKLTASGTLSNFMAPAGSVQVWQYAVAGAQPGVYRLDLAPVAAAASPLLSTTQVVNPSGTSTTSYAFVVTLPSAGAYNLAVNDFQFPDSLPSLSATVAQNGTVLTQSASGDFMAVQGPVVILVNTSLPASGSGIFGVTVETTGASPQPVTGGEFTQAVGGVFNSQSITLGTSGNFNAALTDLKFPAAFQNLAVLVSNGGTILGKIYGGGNFVFPASPGTYLVTFVATPSTQNYGLYSLNISSAAPTVTFTSSASSVSAGGTVTLTWSSQSATSCTASGGSGWTGSQATSGTLAVSVAATETLTLSCTGPGGSASQSVTITATAAASGGGGGALGLPSILGLIGIWGAALRARQRRFAARPTLIRRASAG
jgi:plastocyanin